MGYYCKKAFSKSSIYIKTKLLERILKITLQYFHKVLIRIKNIFEIKWSTYFLFFICDFKYFFS